MRFPVKPQADRVQEMNYRKRVFREPTSGSREKIAAFIKKNTDAYGSQGFNFSLGIPADPYADVGL